MMAGSEPVEQGNWAVGSEAQERANRIDKSVLAFGEARRLRDKDRLKYVASRSCLICGRQPSEPHHVRFAQRLAFGRKVSDEFTVPLCRLHHRELHRSRNEPLWWKTARIDPIPIARKLWEGTRPQAPPSQAAPVPSGTSPACRRAVGRKVTDEFTRLHNRELHRSRNEPLWWKMARIDPIAIARPDFDQHPARSRWAPVVAMPNQGSAL